MGVGQELAEALWRREEDKVGELLSRLESGTVNESDARGLTPLHAACASNNVAAVAKVLTIPGVYVNVKANYMITPIMLAAEYGSCDSMRMLLDHPAVDVNVRNNYSWTALMQAAAYCHVDALGMLLDHPKVDLDIKNKNGSGVVELVGVNAPSSTEKSKCLAMIQKAKKKRRNIIRETRQASNENDFSEPSNELPNKNLEKDEKMNRKHQNEKTALENKLVRTFSSDSFFSHKATADQLARDTRKLDLQPANNATPSNMEALKNTLKCPVCLEIMRPPTRIWMCSSSHLVCEDCKEKLHRRQCPTCRTEIVNLRAHMAENFSTHLFQLLNI